MRSRFPIIAVFAIAFVASCDRQKHSGPQPEMCVFGVAIYERDDETREYQRLEAISGYSTAVPSEYFSPKYLPMDFSETLKLKAVKLDGHSADFRVSYGNEEKAITATPAASHVEFADGKWRIEITIVATTVSPFLQNEKRMSSPVRIYRTEIYWTNKGKTDSDHIRGRKILDSKEITDKATIERIQSMLTNSDNYSISGAMCFHPRTAISFGSADSICEVLFCRECSWMYVYGSNDKSDYCLKYGLTREMHDLVDELRDKYFPDENGE